MTAPSVFAKHLLLAFVAEHEKLVKPLSQFLSVEEYGVCIQQI